MKKVYLDKLQSIENKQSIFQDRDMEITFIVSHF